MNTLTKKQRYGCPICGYKNENEDEIVEHMLDMSDNPDHLRLEELEQAYYSRSIGHMSR